jgi:hypothetical protein
MPRIKNELGGQLSSEFVLVLILNKSGYIRGMTTDFNSPDPLFGRGGT